jgi:hypothetical protein
MKKSEDIKYPIDPKENIQYDIIEVTQTKGLKEAIYSVANNKKSKIDVMSKIWIQNNPVFFSNLHNNIHTDDTKTFFFNDMKAFNTLTEIMIRHIRNKIGKNNQLINKCPFYRNEMLMTIATQEQAKILFKFQNKFNDPYEKSFFQIHVDEIKNYSTIQLLSIILHTIFYQNPKIVLTSLRGGWSISLRDNNFFMLFEWQPNEEYLNS